MTTARRRCRALVALLPAALLLAVGACGGDDEPDEDPPETTAPDPTAAPTTAAPSPEDEVEAAYLAYWEMAARLSAAPDPDDPEIAERAVDPARSTMVDTLSTLSAQEQALIFGESTTHGLSQISIDGSSAVLMDCAVDDSAIVNAASGDVLQEEVVTSLLEATLSLEGDAWKLSELDVVQSWNGVQPCAD